MTQPDKPTAAPILDYQHSVSPTRQVVKRSAAGSVALAASVFAAFAWMLSVGEYELFLVLVAVVYAGAALAMAVVAEREKDRRDRGRVAIAVLLLSMALSWDTWQCPHARYLSVGPMRFVLSGEACRNMNWPGFWWMPRRGH